MPRTSRLDLTHDFFFPTLLFAALGGMTWAVRGCSGFGGVAGCIFAGATWGAAWWYLSQSQTGEPSRRYNSAWIIIALTIGIGLSGSRGWMQWPSFFEGHIQLDTAHGKFAPIDKSYGFLWLFIAGVPWAGIGACALAWCVSRVGRVRRRFGGLMDLRLERTAVPAPVVDQTLSFQLSTVSSKSGNLVCV